MALGFFTGDDTPDSYEARERKRRLAEALIQQGADYSPVQSWTQGAARLANALSGTIQQNRIGKQEKESSEAYNKLASALMGGSPSPAPSPSVNSAPGPTANPGPAANMPGDMSTWASAIKKKESAGSGDYAAVGPTHPKLGRALGAYQVMEANIGPWSREALGREVTPDEFMKNPQIQDQVFQHKFGQYVQKFGNPQDAASAWFTGRPLAQGAGARDVLGTTGAAYVQDFNRNIGQRPVQMAQAPGPVASDAPPMAYAGAPAGQAIAGASPQPQARPPGQQLAQAVAPTSPPIPQPQPTGNVNAAMYQIMSDPRFSPQQKAQALQMFQMQQAQTNRNPMVIPEGATLYDPRSGRMVQPSGPKMSDAERQYNAAKAGGFQGSFFDYQQQLRRSGATNVNIDNKTEAAADTEAAKILIKRYGSAVEAGDKAQTAMGDINTMREISQRVGSLGASADVKRAIGPYAEAMGINIENLSDIQAFESVIQRMAPTLRAEGSGSTSDIEFKGMLASLPRLSSNPQARAMILDTMEANARYNMMKGEIALDVLTKKITRDEAEKRIKGIGDPMGAFKEFKKANPDLFSGGAAQPKQPEMTPQERALEILRRRSGT